MNKRVLFTAALLFVVLCSIPAFAKLVIISPESNLLTESSVITIIGSEDTADKEEITITIKGTVDGVLEEFSETVDIYDRVFSLDADLYVGENEIVIGNIKINVFYNDGTLTPHKKYKKEVFHKPVLSGCSDCHDTDEPGLPLFSEASELCIECHPRDIKTVIAYYRKKSGKRIKKKKIIKLKNIHKPVKDGNCLFCHKPHSSPNKSLLKEAEVASLCKKCHEKIFSALSKAKKTHPPQKEGKCIKCHSPHASNEKYLFKSSLKKVCFQCHDTFLKDDKGVKKKYVHMPVKNGACYECHDLHFSENQKYFKELTVREVCIKCHTDKKFGTHTLMKKSCLICHSPHTSNNEFLLANNKVDICRECHKDVFKGEFAHSAISEPKACMTCHNLHEPESPDDLKDICFNCHNEKAKVKKSHGGLNMPLNKCKMCHNTHYSTGKSLLGKELHPPFEDGECDACHADEDDFSKFVEQGAELCYQCHDSKEVSKDKKPLKSVHSAITDGDCTDCHSPHVTDYKQFLITNEDKLCLECHDDLLFKKKDLKFNTLHPPAEDGECLECHDPHGSMIKYNLKEKVETLCFNCHDDFAEDFGDDANIHPPYEDRECTTCHSPHGAEADYLIIGGQKEACAQCHDSKTKDDNGVSFSAIHKPVADGKCSKCHDPHVAKYEKQLRFKGNALCLSCHNKMPSHHPLRPESDNEFIRIEAGFKSDGGDFACLGCHNPHASNTAKLFYTSKDILCKRCHIK